MHECMLDGYGNVKNRVMISKLDVIEIAISRAGCFYSQLYKQFKIFRFCIMFIQSHFDFKKHACKL